MLKLNTMLKLHRQDKKHYDARHQHGFYKVGDTVLKNMRKLSKKRVIN